MDLAKLRQELMDDEGLRLKPYLCSAGKLTIGYGRNLTDRGISEDEAVFLLIQDMNEAIISTQAIVGIDYWDDLTDNRKRVLINMCFQLGINGLRKFVKMLAAVRSQNWEGAADEIHNSRAAKQCPARFGRHELLMRAG